MSDQPAQSGGQLGDAAGSFGVAVNSIPVSGGNKEKEAFVTAEPVAEVIELKEPDSVPEEVAGWVEKLERGEDINLQQPVTDHGQVVVSSSQPSGVKIVLPLTQDAVQQGLHAKIVDSMRWLAEWCIRIIKKFPGKVFYRK